MNFWSSYFLINQLIDQTLKYAKASQPSAFFLIARIFWALNSS